VHRIAVNTSTRSVFIQSWKTAELNSHLDLWRADKDRDIEALKIVANWQRKYINYQAVYSAYLIGAINEQQFEAEAEEYVSGAARIEPKLIAPLISRLHRLLDFKLNDNEIAEYLEVDLDSVTKALDLLAAEKSNEKLRVL
jgi:hypothetical protein